MARWGLDVFRDFEERVGGACGFVQAGFLVLVPAEDGEGLRENVALQQGVGIDTRILSPEEIRESAPGRRRLRPRGRGVRAGRRVRRSAPDDHGLRRGREAPRRPLPPRPRGDRRPVLGGRVVGVDTSAGPFERRLVVNCAGPWGARVAAMAGLDVPVASCRAQVAVFGRPEGRRGPHPVVLDFAHASYFRPETGDLMLVGLIDPSEAEDVVDPDDYPEHTDAAFDLDVGAALGGALPSDGGGLTPARLRRPVRHHPRLAPVIDEVPAGSGHFLCTGFSGHGFKLGPAVGLLMAELVTREASDLRCAHLPAGAVAEGQPVGSVRVQHHGVRKARVEDPCRDAHEVGGRARAGSPRSPPSSRLASWAQASSGSVRLESRCSSPPTEGISTRSPGRRGALPCSST